MHAELLKYISLRTEEVPSKRNLSVLRGVQGRRWASGSSLQEVFRNVQNTGNAETLLSYTRTKKNITSRERTARRDIYLMILNQWVHPTWGILQDSLAERKGDDTQTSRLLENPELLALFEALVSRARAPFRETIQRYIFKILSRWCWSWSNIMV